MTFKTYVNTVLILGGVWMGVSGCGAQTESVDPHEYLDLVSIEDMAVEELESDSMLHDEPREPEEGDSGHLRLDEPQVWARQQVMVGLADLPAFGLQLNETISTFRVTLTPTEDGIISREETCKIDIVRRDVTSVKTLIPEAFLNSIPVVTRAVYFDDDQVRFARLLQLQGIYLQDPQNDPLPTDPSDPRIFDQDQDGQPGVTVLIQGIIEGDIQVIQRSVTHLVGTYDEDQMEGELIWESEESVIQGSNEILSRPVNVVVHPDLPSYFIAKKIDPAWKCEQVINELDSLF